MKTQPQFYSSFKISNNNTQQQFRKKYHYQGKKPKRIFNQQQPHPSPTLPDPHPKNLVCFQNCTKWSLTLSTTSNIKKHQISTETITGQISQVNQSIRNVTENVVDFFPIDIRTNQRFALDRNQPKMPLNIEFDCGDDSNNFSNINKEYSSYVFEIDLNASLHSCPRVFKDNINFKVKGYDIIKAIQSRLSTLGTKERNGYLNMKSSSMISFSTNVFNNIQCSFGVCFSISADAIDEFFASSYHNVYLMSAFEIKVTKLKISYNLPLIVFTYPNVQNNNPVFFSQPLPIPFYLNFCNWHSFMSCTTPVIYESENISIKDVLSSFEKAGLFGIGCLLKLDGNYYTKVNFFPTLNNVFINVKDDNTTSGSTSINTNNGNNNGNDTSTLDGSFITSISSQQEEKNNLLINYFLNKKIIFKEQIRESYNVSSYNSQLNSFIKSNPEIEDITLNDITSDSYFSIIWTPTKTPQPMDRNGMKFLENGNLSSFEVFYKFRSIKISNSAHYMTVIGVSEKDIKGRNIDSLNFPMFDYFWFANRSASANQFLMKKELYINKNYFFSFKEFVNNLEISLPQK